MGLLVVLGGARSGKSALAQRLAAGSGAPVTFIATAEARDEEMADRIARHRATRPSGWTTIEAPLEVAAALERVPDGACAVLDCLTLWVANAMEAGWSADRIDGEAARAANRAAARDGATVVVSNEVGMGVVPATELGRTFRDVHGRTNAAFCAVADRSVLVVAGRVLELAPPGALEEVWLHG